MYHSYWPYIWPPAIFPSMFIYRRPVFNHKSPSRINKNGTRESCKCDVMTVNTGKCHWINPSISAQYWTLYIHKGFSIWTNMYWNKKNIPKQSSFVLMILDSKHLVLIPLLNHKKNRHETFSDFQSSHIWLEMNRS